jgi:hypothetical protein
VSTSAKNLTARTSTSILELGSVPEVILVALDVSTLGTADKPTLALVVPALIALVESWLAVAPAAAPDLIVATAVPFTVPVRLPASTVASLVLSTLPKPT